jgi:hypothetical protein
MLGHHYPVTIHSLDSHMTILIKTTLPYVVLHNYFEMAHS